MELINQAQYLLTLPKSLFSRIMNSAHTHNRDPMAEFVYRLHRSFDVVPSTSEEVEAIERLLKCLSAKQCEGGQSDDQNRA